MTQRLCREVAAALEAREGGVGEQKARRKAGRRADDALVDSLCERLFLSRAAQESDDNLAFARNRLLKNEADRTALLDLYAQVQAGKRARYDDTNPLCGILRLSGVVAVKQGIFILRNRVYSAVFDRDWIRAHTPDAELRRQKRAYRLGMFRATIFSAAVLTVVTVLAGFAMKSAISARNAEEKATAQKRLANTRLSHLYVETGTRLMEAGDGAAALAPLTEAMKLDNDDPERMKMHRLRFAAALARSPRIERIWFADAPVRWASYSPDKHWVAAASEDGCARVWNVETGEALPLEMKHEGAVTNAAFSPDGTRLVTCGADGRARVWDLRERRLQYTLFSPPQSHRPGVVHAAWSRDGRRIATCAFGIFLVWDVSGGRAETNRSGGPPAESVHALAPIANAPCLMADKTPNAYLQQVAFTADGNGVTNSSENYSAKTIRIPDETESVFFQLFAKNSQTYHKDLAARGGCYIGRHVAYSADGRRVAIAGAFDAIGGLRGACVFDATTGRAGKLMRHDSIATYVAFSPDERQIATASEDHTARVWDADTGKAITPPMRHAGNVTQIEFSPDGRRVVTASADGTARVWNARTGAAIGYPLHHAGAVATAQFGSDSSHVLTAGYDATVRLWRVAPDQPDSSLFADAACEFQRDSGDTRLFVRKMVVFASLNHAEHGKQAYVCDLATGARLVPLVRAMPNSQQEIVSCADGNGYAMWRLRSSDRIAPLQEAQLWETESGKPLSPVFRVQKIVFSPDIGRAFLCANNAIWAVDANAHSYTRTLLYRTREAISVMQLTPDNRQLLVSAAFNALQMVDARTGKARSLPMPLEARLDDAVFSPDGRYLFTQTAAHVCRMWNTGDGANTLLLSDSSDKKDKYTAAHVYFSPDSKYAITANALGAQLWPLAQMKPRRITWRPASETDKFVFSPDSATFFALYTGSQLHSVQPGTPPTPSLNHNAKVTCLAFSPDGQRLISGSEDGSARIWDARASTPLTPPMPHEETFFQAVFSPDGRLAATGSDGGGVRVWDTATGEALTPSLRITDKVKAKNGVTTLEFTRDSGTLIASSFAAGRFWKLRATSESLPRLQALTYLLSGQRYDVGSGMIPLDASSLRAAWKRYQP